MPVTRRRRYRNSLEDSQDDQERVSVERLSNDTTKDPNNNHSLTNTRTRKPQNISTYDHDNQEEERNLDHQHRRHRQRFDSEPTTSSHDRCSADEEEEVRTDGSADIDIDALAAGIERQCQLDNESVVEDEPISNISDDSRTQVSVS